MKDTVITALKENVALLYIIIAEMIRCIKKEAMEGYIINISI